MRGQGRFAHSARQAARPAANYRGTGNQQEAPTSLDAGAQRDYDATMGEPTTTSR